MAAIIMKRLSLRANAESLLVAVNAPIPLAKRAAEFEGPLGALVCGSKPVKIPLLSVGMLSSSSPVSMVILVPLYSTTCGSEVNGLHPFVIAFHDSKLNNLSS